jgi:hypothetical protein
MQTLFIYFLGLIFGLTFPDYDYLLEKIIGHRSVFTHSIFLTYVLFKLAKKKKNLKFLKYILGVTNGIIIHLISDLNLPSNLIGIQTIKFFSFDLGNFSIFWILMNIGGGLYFVEKYKIEKKIKIEFLNLFICILFIGFFSDSIKLLIIFYILLKTIFFISIKKVNNDQFN